MLSAVIDRFEEDKAVLLVGDEEIKVNFPRKLLDKKLKEGDYITLDIKYDAKTTKEAQEEVQNLLKSLKDKNN
ncbi:hypothetical protein B5F82_00765 [Megamonas hypermegale]|jgi:hypothetical protein|uniref:DUF3006 domain-containing protein n=1 Tax=Megamonas hypermegale TaxID=158847 RepID=UPI000B36DAA1|nr:DUF3006 domain-containing protein [Megamonas hypermegale]MBM6832801.1 DUF3006 domain-containing protein [Megamonas hypermegale]OUO41741.1 hypothetical protein B5F82_00765 [Megamonas hypermegale]